MGVVYEAEQERPRRHVALKLMSSAGLATAAQRRRFEREAQAAADLNHPGVVTIHEFGEVADQPYFSMELVEGEELGTYVVEHELSVRDKLSLMQRVCEAVAYAHQRGVIHRDLKPANILVREDGQHKVLDFGLAKLTELTAGEALGTLTMDGQVLGTVPYMAPEQTLGQQGEIDVRTDVYALGVILYEVITDALPYDLQTADVLEAMRRIREQEPRRPSTIARAVDDEVETILLKALAKEKERRYQSADALAADIGHYLAGEAIEAKRASAVYQLWKLAHRYRAVLIPVAVALATVLAVAVVAFIRIRSERDRAVVAERDAQIAQAETASHRRPAVAAREEEARQRQAAQTVAREAERESYYNAIALADAKLEDGLYDQVKRLLWSVTEEHRRWEWGRLMHLCHLDLVTLKWPSGSPPTSVAWTADGGRAATGFRDGTVRIWDADTCEDLLVLRGHEREVGALTFFSEDRRLLTASPDGTVRIWDAETGRELRVLKAHPPSQQGGVGVFVALNADGSRMAINGPDLTARVWDVASGTELSALEIPGERPIRVGLDGYGGVAISPDGKHALTFGADEAVSMWDAATGQELLAFGGHSAVIGHPLAAFSPDGRRVATFDEKAVRIWDVATGAELLAWTLPATGRPERGPRHLAFWPDGRRLMAQRFGGPATVWDSETGEQVSVWPEGVLGSRWAFPQDGRQVLTEAGLRDPKTGKLLVALQGHESFVSSAALSPGGTRVLTASADGTVRIWRAKVSRDVLSLGGHSGLVNSAAFAPDGHFVLTAGYDGTARIWDSNTGEELLSLGPPPTLGESVDLLDDERGAVLAAAFSPDGRSVATAHTDGKVKVWNATTGREELSLPHHFGSLSADSSYLAFSPDGRRLVTSGSRGEAVVLDAMTGEELAVLAGHGRARRAAFSPDGGRIVTVQDFAGASEDRAPRVWDAETGQELLSLPGHADGTLSAAYSADGELVATGGRAGTAKIWDARTGRELVALEGHERLPISAVAFSPDGSRVATASFDSRIKIWDVETGRELLTLADHPGNYVSLAFSQDGRLLLAGGRTGTRIWEAVDSTLSPEGLAEVKRQRYRSWLEGLRKD